MDKFEEKEMTKRPFFKKHLVQLVLFANELYSQVHKKKTVGIVKSKIMSLLKRNATKNYSKPRRVNNVYEVGRSQENQKQKNNQKTE